MLQLARFLKLSGVCALAVGAVLAMVTAHAPRLRLVALGTSGLGLALTWGAGFWLASLLNTNVLSTYVVGALALSLITVQATLFTAWRQGRPAMAGGTVALLAWAGALALMVWRPA